MMKYFEMKHTPQCSAKRRGTVHMKDVKSTKLTPFRRTTISAGIPSGEERFGEITRTLRTTEKSFSYNLSKSVTEENQRYCQQQRLLQGANPTDKYGVVKDKDIHSTHYCISKNITSEGRRHNCSANGCKTSPRVPRKEWTCLNRRQQLHETKRMHNSDIDRHEPHKNLKSTDRSKKRCSKCQRICNHTTRGKKEGHEAHLNGCNDTETEYRRVNDVEQTEKNKTTQKLQISPSDSSYLSHSESRLQSFSKYPYDENVRNEKTDVQLSPSITEIGQVTHAKGKGSLGSSPCSRVSSGSRKSSVSQRSVMSVISATSTSSLAEKIIEARLLLRTHDIFRDQKSGSVDSEDSLPSGSISKQLSINSDESAGEVSFVTYSKESNIVASNQTGHENGKHCLQQGTVSFAGSKKHSPDATPKERENSIPIKPGRKYIRRVFEA